MITYKVLVLIGGNFENFFQRFNDPVFRGILGLAGGAGGTAEASYQLVRLIERLRINRVLSAVSDSTLAKRQLQDQQVPDSVEYSESLTPAPSHDSSVGSNSPAKGRKSKKMMKSKI